MRRSVVGPTLGGLVTTTFSSCDGSVILVTFTVLLSSDPRSSQSLSNAESLRKYVPTLVTWKVKEPSLYGGVQISVNLFSPVCLSVTFTLSTSVSLVSRFRVTELSFTEFVIFVR